MGLGKWGRIHGDTGIRIQHTGTNHTNKRTTNAEKLMINEKTIIKKVDDYIAEYLDGVWQQILHNVELTQEEYDWAYENLSVTVDK